MGIDYGKKRVGVALSDEAGNFAMPETVLENGPDLMKKLNALIIERNVCEVVLGDSKDFSGKDNKIQEDIIKFKNEVQDKLGMSVVFEPELLTSKEAMHIQGEGKLLDASAAALILKGYLDKKNN
jgi:putative holliday junction resolvase